MYIDKSKLRTLWYENDKGEKWDNIYDKENNICEPPKGFIYQHSQFPYILRHNILEILDPEKVKQCNHPEKYIVPTFGWVDGVEGRECKKCYGHQTKKVKDTWPDKWEADGSRNIFTGESSYPEDLVLSLVNSGEYTLSEAIIIGSNCCERCLNVLIYSYVNKKDGYPENSEEWKECNTKCDFCITEKKVTSSNRKKVYITRNIVKRGKRYIIVSKEIESMRLVIFRLKSEVRAIILSRCL